LLVLLLDLPALFLDLARALDDGAFEIGVRAKEIPVRLTSESTMLERAVASCAISFREGTLRLTFRSPAAIKFAR